MEENESKKKFWTEHIRKWEVSGLSRKEYSRQNDLKVSTFDYYRKKHAGKKGKFVEITADRAQRNEGIEIRIREGIGIRITSGFDEHLLRTIIACLEER